MAEICVQYNGWADCEACCGPCSSCTNMVAISTTPPHDESNCESRAAGICGGSIIQGGEPITNNVQLFGKFFNGETINTNELQAGIDKGEDEALKVVDNIIKSGKYDKRIKKTKTSDNKEGVERLDEGIFCCWRNGGCCFYELDTGTEEYPDAGGIMWDGCCDIGSPKGCCGGVYNTWNETGGGTAEKDLSQQMSEELKEEIKRYKELL
mgnify:CR=1 FL=1